MDEWTHCYCTTLLEKRPRSRGSLDSGASVQMGGRFLTGLSGSSLTPVAAAASGTCGFLHDIQRSSRGRKRVWSGSCFSVACTLDIYNYIHVRIERGFWVKTSNWGKMDHLKFCRHSNQFRLIRAHFPIHLGIQ